MCEYQRLKEGELPLKTPMKFDDTFVQIENERNIINKHASPWGNSEVTITEEDIAALRAGKVLFHDDGEYGTFVKLQDNK